MKHILTHDFNQLTDIQKVIYKIIENKWDEAHNIVQKHEGKRDFDRLHAFLHRIEPDDFNARWWYRMLKMDYPKVSPDEELKALLSEFFD